MKCTLEPERRHEEGTRERKLNEQERKEDKFTYGNKVRNERKRKGEK
jgi:hypothetical protein